MKTTVKNANAANNSTGTTQTAHKLNGHAVIVPQAHTGLVKLTPTLLSKFARFLESEKQPKRTSREVSQGLCVRIAGAEDNLYLVSVFTSFVQFLNKTTQGYYFAHLELRDKLDAALLLFPNEMKALKGLTVTLK